jgi:pilus assembly protein Flp/PilA
LPRLAAAGFVHQHVIEIETERRLPVSSKFQVDQMQLIRNLVCGEDGATSIEYALIASMIAMAIIVGVQTMGTQLSTTYVEIGNAL